MATIYITAFLIGLAGSTHCLGMCGGIVAGLNMGAQSTQRSRLQKALFNLSYNVGRIVSYGLAGGVLATIAAVASPLFLATVAPIGHVLAGLITVALGLYIAGWWAGVGHLERIGVRLWRHIEPFGRRFIPARSPAQAVGLGLVWGWLPCGLVYSALALAATTGQPLSGATVMMTFGLGTLPMLLAMGWAVTALQAMMRHRLVRAGAGVFIIVLGIYTLATAGSHHHHVSSADGSGQHFLPAHSSKDDWKMTLAQSAKPMTG